MNEGQLDTLSVGLVGGRSASRATYLRDLLYELVVRDMKLRYKRSALGVGWSLLNPFAQLLVFRFVFETILPTNVPNFTSFLFTGVLVWNWFQMSLMISTTSVVDNRELIKRPGFPAAILPLVTVTSYLVHFVFALPILIAVLIYDGMNISGAIGLLPVFMAIQFALTLGAAYLAATMHVTFRDTQYLLGVGLQLLFFLTPIFYDVSGMPQSLRTIYHLNPLVSLIDGYRSILLDGRFPSLNAVLALTAVAGGFLTFGYAAFARASRHFADEL
jgi:lipopolysaccharide transport system permease protein